MVWPVKAGYVPVARDGRGGTIFHCICINPEGEGATVDQELDVLRPVGDGVKRLDANMKGMVMITTPSVSSIQTQQSHGNQIFWIFLETRWFYSMYHCMYHQSLALNN